MKKIVVLLGFAVLVFGQASAGVVVEMIAGDPETGGEAKIDKIYAKGGMLRMDPHPEDGADDATVLFRDDTLWLIDHQEKRAHRVDKEGMEKVSAQISAAMKQMEVQMAQLPPEQQEMMKKMMRERMPAMAGALEGEAPERRVEKGAAEKIGGYACTAYTMFSGERKVWEVCAASESELGSDAHEVIVAVRGMSNFAEQLREAVRQTPFAEIVDTPFQAMDEIEGFPIRVRGFGAGGAIDDVSTLRSITPEELGDELFAVPDGYEVVNLADQVGQGR
jgi:hypothetical protein